MKAVISRKKGWRPPQSADLSLGVEGLQTAYHHGRRLRGESTLLSKEYQGLGCLSRCTLRVSPGPGIVARSRSLPAAASPPPDDDAADGAAENVEGCKSLVQVATFEAVTNWAHEAAPEKSDIFAIGLKEWTSFAKLIHE